MHLCSISTDDHPQLYSACVNLVNSYSRSLNPIHKPSVFTYSYICMYVCTVGLPCKTRLHTSLHKSNLIPVPALLPVALGSNLVWRTAVQHRTRTYCNIIYSGVYNNKTSNKKGMMIFTGKICKLLIGVVILWNLFRTYPFSNTKSTLDHLSFLFLIS